MYVRPKQNITHSHLQLGVKNSSRINQSTNHSTSIKPIGFNQLINFDISIDFNQPKSNVKSTNSISNQLINFNQSIDFKTNRPTNRFNRPVDFKQNTFKPTNQLHPNHRSISTNQLHPNHLTNQLTSQHRSAHTTAGKKKKNEPDGKNKNKNRAAD